MNAGATAGLGFYRFERKTRQYFVYTPDFDMEGTRPPLYVPRPKLGSEASPPSVIQVEIGWGAA